MPDIHCAEELLNLFVQPKMPMNPLNSNPDFRSISILTIVIKILAFSLIIINKKTIYS